MSEKSLAGLLPYEKHLAELAEQRRLWELRVEQVEASRRGWFTVVVLSIAIAFLLGYMLAPRQASAAELPEEVGAIICEGGGIAPRWDLFWPDAYVQRTSSAREIEHAVNFMNAIGIGCWPDEAGLRDRKEV